MATLKHLTGLTIASLLATGLSAQAHTHAGAKPMNQGYQNSQKTKCDPKTTKCANAKCGASKSASASCGASTKTTEGKCGEGKCGEGKCGAPTSNKTAGNKNANASCGGAK